jgi:molybdopterin-guanine dinucleotide biosynthesis protein A
MILGAVLAGGRSTRFGSDKALAELGGETLLDRAVRELEAWCDRVIVVGRDGSAGTAIPDWPAPDMGPLAGIAAALRFADIEGFAAVLTCGVDSVDLPADLPEMLGAPPACLASQPVVGLWPATAAEAASAMLESDGSHSIYAFARRAGAREVVAERAPANINTLADLAAAELRSRL